jgi:capsular polysaccharide transport system permease protein
MAAGLSARAPAIAAPAIAAPAIAAPPVAANPAGSPPLPGATGLPVPAGQREMAPAGDPRLFAETAAAAPRRGLSFAGLSFVLVVALPVTLAVIYYFLVAADQYAAEFRFALRSAEPVRELPGGPWPSDGAAAPVVSDSYIVVQYIRSRALVDDLGAQFDLRQIFATDRADWPARLHLPVSVEALVEYWKGQADAFFDATDGTIVVRVRAFARDDALRLAQGVRAAAERLVNRLSQRARENALRDAKDEVARSESRLQAALARLRNFRDRQGLIDPNQAANSSQALADRVRDALVKARTQLTTLQQYMRADAPPVKLLETRIAALEEQERAIASGVTATAGTRSPALSGVMGRFEELESERHFAESAYQRALEALDRSRQNAERQQVYIADFVPPLLPEEALYPRRVRALGIVFLVAFAIWAIGGLTVRSVRDHL